MRVLVTGGSGFIGGAVARILEQRGTEVDIAGLHPPELDTAVKFIYCDILDRDQLAALDDYDTIIHMAGMVGTVKTFDHIIDTERVNVIGTLNLLERFKNCSVFIQPGINGDWLNPYMISKRASERYGLMYGQYNNMKYISIRLTDVYGPGQSLEQGKAVPTFISKALRGASLPIYGDGSYEMRLMYVDDAARVIIGVATNAEEMPSVVYAAPLHMDNNITITQLANMILALTHSASLLEYKPMRKGQPKDVTGYDVDMDHAKRLLDKLGITELLIQDGLRSTIRYYESSHYENSKRVAT